MFGKRQQIETVTKIFCVDNHHTYAIHMFLFDCLPIALDTNFIVKLVSPADIPDPANTPSPELTDLPSIPLITTSIPSSSASSASSASKPISKNLDAGGSSSNLNSLKDKDSNSLEDGGRKIGLLAPPALGEKETVAVSYNYVNKTDQVIRWNTNLASMGSGKIKFEYTIQSNEGGLVDSYTQNLPASIFNVCF
eukprot:TRINITY_DN4835_c0_g2_i1.p1 TRINITY_DN4835_c0_g2~~TRINITY_DN4835_c0_g2_i1.p1  ORF type:complete len:194 (-),score=46.09 TRINITY_DN4835_c0_g2_i1:210-791(-)